MNTARSLGSQPVDGLVRTVLGDVDAATLGHTQPHEHLLCDMSPILRGWGVQPLDGDITPLPPEKLREFPASTRRLVTEPIRLDNYDWIRRHVLNVDNLRLLSEDDAIAELQRYRAAGGATVVDSTPVGLGRDPLGCARIARSTGINVIVGSGYYVRDYHPPGLDARAETDIFDEIVRDIQVGIGDTGVRAGIIGEIGLSWPVHTAESKVLRAAVHAQQETGAALQIHPGRSPEAPAHALRLVREWGGELERTVMSHIDRTLYEPADILELARTGCYLEFDLFGQENSYYAFNPDARRPTDATRIDWLRMLIDAGFGDRILISQDICQKVYLRQYGGPGYTHILENVVPQMLRMGLSQEVITEVTVTNPAAMLALR